jgi:hypothetical protein
MDSKERQSSEQEKKRYLKPEIVYQQSLEAMAIACTLPTSKASEATPPCAVPNLFS